MWPFGNKDKGKPKEPMGRGQPIPGEAAAAVAAPIPAVAAVPDQPPAELLFEGMQTKKKPKPKAATPEAQIQGTDTPESTDPPQQTLLSPPEPVVNAVALAAASGSVVARRKRKGEDGEPQAAVRSATAEPISQPPRPPQPPAEPPAPKPKPKPKPKAAKKPPSDSDSDDTESSEISDDTDSDNSDTPAPNLLPKKSALVRQTSPKPAAKLPPSDTPLPEATTFAEEPVWKKTLQEPIESEAPKPEPRPEPKLSLPAEPPRAVGTSQLRSGSEPVPRKKVIVVKKVISEKGGDKASTAADLGPRSPKASDSTTSRWEALCAKWGGQVSDIQRKLADVNVELVECIKNKQKLHQEKLRLQQELLEAERKQEEAVQQEDFDTAESLNEVTAAAQQALHRISEQSLELESRSHRLGVQRRDLPNLLLKTIAAKCEALKAFRVQAEAALLEYSQEQEHRFEAVIDRLKDEYEAVSRDQRNSDAVLLELGQKKRSVEEKIETSTKELRQENDAHEQQISTLEDEIAELLRQVEKKQKEKEELAGRIRENEAKMKRVASNFSANLKAIVGNISQEEARRKQWTDKQLRLEEEDRALAQERLGVRAEQHKRREFLRQSVQEIKRSTQQIEGIKAVESKIQEEEKILRQQDTTLEESQREIESSRAEFNSEASTIRQLESELSGLQDKVMAAHQELKDINDGLLPGLERAKKAAMDAKNYAEAGKQNAKIKELQSRVTELHTVIGSQDRELAIEAELEDRRSQFQAAREALQEKETIWVRSKLASLYGHINLLKLQSASETEESSKQLFDVQLAFFNSQIDTHAAAVSLAQSEVVAIAEDYESRLHSMLKDIEPKTAGLPELDDVASKEEDDAPIPPSVLGQVKEALTAKPSHRLLVTPDSSPRTNTPPVSNRSHGSGDGQDTTETALPATGEKVRKVTRVVKKVAKKVPKAQEAAGPKEATKETHDASGTVEDSQSSAPALGTTLTEQPLAPVLEQIAETEQNSAFTFLVATPESSFAFIGVGGEPGADGSQEEAATVPQHDKETPELDREPAEPASSTTPATLETAPEPVPCDEAATPNSSFQFLRANDCAESLLQEETEGAKSDPVPADVPAIEQSELSTSRVPEGTIEAPEASRSCPPTLEPLSASNGSGWHSPGEPASPEFPTHSSPFEADIPDGGTAFAVLATEPQVEADEFAIEISPSPSAFAFVAATEVANDDFTEENPAATPVELEIPGPLTPERALHEVTATEEPALAHDGNQSAVVDEDILSSEVVALIAESSAAAQEAPSIQAPQFYAEEAIPTSHAAEEVALASDDF